MSYARLDTPLPGANSVLSRPTTMFKPSYPSAKTSLTASRRKRLLFSYLPDWILTLVLAALFFSLDKVDGYRRLFSVEESSIRHPYAVHERVPNVALYMIAIVAPLVIMPVINFFTVRSWWDFHNSSLGCVLGLSITGAFTQVVKITVGRPRPDLLSRCQPPAGLTDPQYGLTSWTVCTQTEAAILRDGFRSFFSGHSSLSFAGLGFLSYYLAGKMHLFDDRGHAGKAWLSVSPFMAALLVAVSRTMDYRHHWQDVLVGSAVGTLLSYFSYRQYYPPLHVALSHRPYSPRIKREDDLNGHSHQLSESNGILPTHHDRIHRRYESNAESVGGGHGYEDDGHRRQDDALDGTVLRPDPGPLEEVWKDGEGSDENGKRTVYPPPAMHSAPAHGGPMRG